MNKVLQKMLDRLLAGLMSGANMNCRPHASRQRVDLMQLAKLGDMSPEEVLKNLLGPEKSAKITARVKLPRKAHQDEEAKTPAERAWIDQTNLLGKLRVIADDARTYENDTGVTALSIGFPILSLPPGSFGGGSRGNSAKRILAPIAFVPVTLLLKRGATPVVELACRSEGVDRVVANTALLSWIEQQTGRPQNAEVFDDEEGVDPWREICKLVKHVAEAMQLPNVLDIWQREPGGSAAGSSGADSSGEPIQLPIPQSPAPSPGTQGEGGGKCQTSDGAGLQNPDTNPPVIADEQVSVLPGHTRLASEDLSTSGSHPNPEKQAEPAAEPPGSLPAFSLQPAPRGDDESDQPAILLSAVLGLFPTAHQGLLRDTRAMLADENPLIGPIQNFLTSGIDFDAPVAPATPAPTQLSNRAINTERLAAAADPCQARAVALARQATGLVIHGPPGTGKSQTITNIIADHLARGQRVLLVCDKRTALDVVADRLEHMGLRSLCGIVHDPQRDQRDLYRSIHQQLDELPEAKLYPRAAAALEKADAELQQLHDELTGYHNALMKPAADGGPSFHELMGEWMSCQSDGQVMLNESAVAGISVENLHEQRAGLAELFARAANVDYFKNPWAKCAGVSLADFLSRPMAEARTAMSRILAAAGTADAAADERIPSFTDVIPVADQARARLELVGILAELLPKVVQTGQGAWICEELETIRDWRTKFDGLKESLPALRSTTVDPALAVSMAWPGETSLISLDRLALRHYLDATTKWWSLLALGIKSRAAQVLKKFSLPLTPENADHVARFIEANTVRFPLALFCTRVSGKQPAAMPDAEIENFFQVAEQWFPLLERIATDPALAGIGALMAKLHAACGFVDVHGKENHEPFSDGPEGGATDGGGVEDPSMALRAIAKPGAANRSQTADFLEGLRLSTARADAITRLDEELAASMLFDPKWHLDFSAELRKGKQAHDTAAALADRLDQLEGVLRVRAGRAAVPAMLAPAVDQILSQAVASSDAIAALNQKVLTNAIIRRLRENPMLQTVDAHRIESNFDRYRKLDAEKKILVRDAVAHLWVSKQKERLLSSTGSRLNSTGTDLRRRLITRGERAMRLRQVIAIGDSLPGGDPLFDLCPVWMASPETVAQIFPRKAMFDAVIFDEASQCRLEEALPVLTRGRRVVIAGDPNQLPPTRFFESGLVQSQQEEAETEQELFESQQGEIEDLLAAALNLAIEQCYLDVHYRSRNSDLIEFSNRNFYSSRLQAIPGHPSNRTKYSPLTLYRVDGTYSKRTNPAEADRVVQIVHDLLKRAEPPSIGIACLNLPQRDLIVEKLDDLAADDADFAKRLADSRIRKGKGSFEGLFVKNLENVQGDERDHIIISTTYGPDEQGKFYRRFGPVGMAGGGRRLNVLVTRARCEVHLVTSIPGEAYRSLPAVPPGQAASGAWLLFAYLKYAEELVAEYGNANIEHSTSSMEHRNEQVQIAPVVNVLPSKSPSVFAGQLGEALARAMKIGSDVHWGNDGFCVDLALHHPVRPGDVTIGVLCDGCRYAAADDAVEWDIFRTGILGGQGWILRRIWTPHFFRDPQGNQMAIRKSADEFVAGEKPVDALATTGS
jgi:hypothetical protein